MSRCKACNRELSTNEMLGVQEDGSPEDMCIVCRYKAREESYPLIGYNVRDPEEYGLITRFLEDNNFSVESW